MPTKIRQNACTGLKNMLKIFGKRIVHIKLKGIIGNEHFLKMITNNTYILICVVSDH